MPPTPDAILAEEERIAEETYARVIGPSLKPEDAGKYIAIDIGSGDFEIDANDFAATGRFLARRLGARLWLMRTGPSAACKLRAAA